MTRNVVRLTATLGAAALVGLAGTALAGAASAAPATSASPASAQALHFIAFYPDKASCQVGGEYYKRHGYSGYICQLDSMRGWALYVQD
jgi:nitrous oxide reductase